LVVKKQQETLQIKIRNHRDQYGRNDETIRRGCFKTTR